MRKHTDRGTREVCSVGIYLNPGADKFREALRSEIYVDKTGMIATLNRFLGTSQKYVCVSRPRRFGKTMAADMVAAYYDRTVDGATLFHGRAIEHAATFDRCRNCYDVLHVNMQECLSGSSSMDALLSFLKNDLLEDLAAAYPDVSVRPERSLPYHLQRVYQHTRRPFVIVIDEWDSIFREYRERKADQERYLDFLRDWLKDKSYIALCYMTGILPIKKYGTHSALNMFDEYAMTGPGPLAAYVGFTSAEVQALCAHYAMDFAAAQQWYDGYAFPSVGEIYNPRSVVAAMLRHTFGAYWNQTETFEALKIYIDLNLDGLRDAVIRLMAGERQPIEIGTFSNDMTTFHTRDDVLTLLIHLGYLAYDVEHAAAYIPNKELMIEFANATSAGGWDEVTRAIQGSKALLEATWRMDADAVAAGIAAAHMETSHLTYNDENALAYTISLAYYAAREMYTFLRELPTGKGFADLVFLPRPNRPEIPALLVELKWNQDARTAIKQIHEKKYPAVLKDYGGKLLLIGISYDRKTKKHMCEITRI